jgi:hypothetical protein
MTLDMLSTIGLTGMAIGVLFLIASVLRLFKPLPRLRCCGESSTGAGVRRG